MVSRIQIKVHLQGTAAIIAFGNRIATLAVNHTGRIGVSVIAADELVAVAVIARNRLTHHADERVACLVLVQKIVRFLWHEQIVAMVDETVIDKRGLDNILRVLQVVLVIVHVPVGGELHMSESTQIALLLSLLVTLTCHTSNSWPSGTK